MIESLLIRLAFKILERVMRKDSDYAWSWQCNLAMMADDAGAPNHEANIRAADLMHNLFRVDTRTRYEAERAKS